MWTTVLWFTTPQQYGVVWCCDFCCIKMVHCDVCLKA